MPIAPKKLSELSELTTLADGDKVPVIDDSASTPATKNKWMSLSTLKAWIGALANPMTNAGDLIVGGESGAPGRLAKGSDGQVLKMVSGAIAWAAHAVGMTNPMTTAGDLIVGGESGAAGRLAKGTDGQVLKVVSGSLAWADDEVGEGGGGGMTNPMTTAGDLIVGGESGAAGRLAKGTDGQVLKVVSGALAWADDEVGEGGGGSTLPVADTTALVKDPVDETKLLRLDAGNVPTESTVVLQSPGVSAVVGLFLVERSISGTPINTGSHLVMVASRAGRVVGASAYATGYGTYPVYLQVTRNGSNQGSPIGLVDADGYSSGNRYGRDGLDFNFAAGDVIDFAVVGAGDSEYGGSGSGGSAMNGTIVFQLEAVYSPA